LLNLSSPVRKNIPLRRLVETALLIRPSRPTEGRFAIVTDAGRDAVDADVLTTNGTEADGEVVWSWRPDAGVKFRGILSRGDGGKKARSPGRARRKP
jgi:hypothetical protein